MMVKTERAGDATALAVGSVAALAAGSRRDRASRYATVAKMAAATAGIGGAAGAVDGAIVSGNTPVVLTSATLGSPTGVKGGIAGDGAIGDTLLAGMFRGVVVWEKLPPYFSARYGGVSAFGGVGAPRFHANLLSTNAQVGGAMIFNKVYMQAGSRGPAGGDVVARTWYDVVIGATNSVRGFVGFKFDNGGTTNFGYFDVEWSRTGVNQGSTLTVTIHGWAYENSGAAITIGGATPIPGGTGLAALAIGAAGLRGRRRSRN
jgi:hypothetical protein